MNILRRVPNSVFWLLEYPLDGVENLKKEAAVRGIDPNRIIFTAKANKHEHINRCYLADLSLDNPITNGHTTTCDLLWSGLPILTYPVSEQMPSRVAASICAALECPELIVSSYEDYENTAVRLAITDPYEEMKGLSNLPEHLNKRQGSAQLKLIRQKIENKRLSAPLFNT